jgi:hypothetical protein
MDFLSELVAAASEIRHPSPPRDLLDDVQRRRGEGRRAILPMAPVSAPPRRRVRVLVAGLAIAALAGLATVFVSSEAGAGASELLFEPAAPVAGQSLRVTYRTGSELAGRPALRLRARLRGPGALPPRTTLGEYEEVVLTPDDGRTYSGTFDLPLDAVYAAFAVEDLTGEHVDHRDGHLWELRTYERSGVPSLSSLRQEFLARQDRDWPRAGDRLREMTRLFPDRAEGWSRMLVHELPVLSPDETAASLAMHKEMFLGLQERMLGAGNLPTEELESLVRYARALDEAEAEATWLRRLEQLHPGHPMVLQARLVSHYEEGRAPAALDFLEASWSEGHRSAVVYEAGLNFALASGDPPAVRRWARRGLQSTEDHGWAKRAVLAMVSHPLTRAEGIEQARDLLDRLDQIGDDRRPLHHSRAEARLEARRLQRQLLTGLGGALLQVNEPAAALRELERADRLGGWQPALYRWRLEAGAALGDTAAALRDFHRLMADPVYPRVTLDSLRSTLGTAVGTSRAPIATAYREMVDALLAGLPAARRIPRATLVSETGAAITLRQLVENRATVLVFWDRRVQMTEAAVTELHTATRLLDGSAGQLIWVTSEPQSSGLQAFSRQWNLNVPRFQDPGSGLATTLGEWRARAYYVIDRGGDIRGRPPSLPEAVRLLRVLEQESRGTV